MFTCTLKNPIIFVYHLPIVRTGILFVRFVVSGHNISFVLWSWRGRYCMCAPHTTNSGVSQYHMPHHSHILVHLALSNRVHSLQVHSVM